MVECTVQIPVFMVQVMTYYVDLNLVFKYD